MMTKFINRDTVISAKKSQMSSTYQAARDTMTRLRAIVEGKRPMTKDNLLLDKVN